MHNTGIEYVHFASCRAEPFDVEDAAAAGAVSTAAMATTATAVAAAPKQPVAAQEVAADEAVMVSGPHLPEAIGKANTGEAEMIPVPVAEQRVTALAGPGINAAFLPGSSESAMITTAAEAPRTEDGLPVQSHTASSVAVITTAASATLVASEQSADNAGHASASVMSAAAAVTSVAVVAASSRECDQNTADGTPKVSDKASSHIWSESVSPMATAMRAESSFRSQADNLDAPAAAAVAMQQAQPSVQQFTADEQADSLASAGSSLQQPGTSSGQVSSTLAQQSIQAEVEAGEDGGSSGEQTADGKQSKPLVPLDRDAPLLPSVKQSVLRLEQMHAAMRNKV